MTCRAKIDVRQGNDDPKVVSLAEKRQESEDGESSKASEKMVETKWDDRPRNKRKWT